MASPAVSSCNGDSMAPPSAACAATMACRPSCSGAASAASACSTDCSELYPRAATYRSCNWCLRDQEGGGDPPPATAGAKRTLNDSRDDDVGCTRSEFSPEPGKLVKKPKKGHERMAQRPLPAAKGRRREVQDSGGRKARRFRVKVRRYKLLAEVIC
ncbi:hypothetical protein ACP4OV_006388 [Aristida adscensionis]